MKIGQAVRVIAHKSCIHDFALGEIVYRALGPEDNQRFLGFKNSAGHLRYMLKEEYELGVSLEEDVLRRKILREETIALIERFILKNEIFQAAIEALAESSEEAEYLRSLTVDVKLY